MSKFIVSVINCDEGSEPVSVEIETEMADLLCWWMQTAANDFNATVPKIEEYGTGLETKAAGSADIRAIGYMFSEMAGLPEDTDSAVRQQLAAWAYLVGKLGRCIANLRMGHLIKDDTLLDSSVYSMMLRRIGETGNWP